MDQFKNYVNGIYDINELNYVFNSAKLSEAAARTGMTNFITNKKPAIFAAMSQQLKASLELDDITDLTPAKIEQMVNIFVQSKP